ncbi:MAG: oligosaccharide flippase family protein, partial [Candidatus Faecousia sp.]|nr:oligosaccharide flippase family protein [Candidatus Faecousia sp.]
MKASVQKQKFLQGAGILTVGILLNKIISAVYKLPLTRLIGKEAVGHFSVAYNIYELMMVIAAAGLPVALSRLISEASARGERRQMQRIFRVSLVVFLTIGLVGGAGLLLFSRQIAARMNDTAADAALRMLAPAIFFFCLFCAFRGYYQGQQYMTPTSVSQIVEALCKLGVGLSAVLIAVRMGLGPGASAACAVMGVSA